jgi:hypothetical protein
MMKALPINGSQCSMQQLQLVSIQAKGEKLVLALITGCT